MGFGKLQHCVAPVSKDGPGPWFETPRTKLRNLDRPKRAAPHTMRPGETVWQMAGATLSRSLRHDRPVAALMGAVAATILLHSWEDHS
jgi:hypothetical protein